MPFMHKLSRRLAMLKDRRAISVAVVVAAVASCERTLPITGWSANLAHLVVLPPKVMLLENASTDFVVLGLTNAGDTTVVAAAWSVTGGTITDSVSANGMHYGHYRAGPQAGTFKVVAQDPSSGLTDSAMAV